MANFLTIFGDALLSGSYAVQFPDGAKLNLYSFRRGKRHHLTSHYNEAGFDIIHGGVGLVGSGTLKKRFIVEVLSAEVQGMIDMYFQASRLIARSLLQLYMGRSLFSRRRCSYARIIHVSQAIQLCKVLETRILTDSLYFEE